MKRISLIGVSMLALCGMWSCGKKVPEEIIQPQAMENLLYDYHLATTMSADLPYDENYKKQAYLAYVFQKHGVTEAEFDSSMVWYSRHRVFTSQRRDEYDLSESAEAHGDYC